jgi:hypothetical protein
MSAGVTILGYPTDTTPLDTGLRSSICIPGEIVAAETNTAKAMPWEITVVAIFGYA